MLALLGLVLAVTVVATLAGGKRFLGRAGADRAELRAARRR
jgi:hypothetical protein